MKSSWVYEYLAATAEYSFIIQPSSLRIFAWIVASLHSNTRSHTGIIIGLGSHKGLVYFRSSVQKLVADSSTYVELIAQRSMMEYTPFRGLLL